MNPITNFEKWINSIATGVAPDILPVTRFEHFLNRIRLAIARKSDIKSGLPDYTAEDKGKALTLVSPTTRFTLVDEQTVTMDTQTNMGFMAENSYRLPDGESVIGKTGAVEVSLTGAALSLTMEGTFAEVEGGTIILDCEGTDKTNVTIAFTGDYAGVVVSNFDVSEILISAYMDVKSTDVEPAWENLRVLPQYTDDDTGKILAVNKTPVTEDKTIVQKQTVSVDENGMGTLAAGSWYAYEIPGAAYVSVKLTAFGESHVLQGKYKQESIYTPTGDYMTLSVVNRDDDLPFTIVLSGVPDGVEGPHAGFLGLSFLSNTDVQIEVWAAKPTGEYTTSPAWDNGGLFVVTITGGDGSFTADKTYVEITREVNRPYPRPVVANYDGRLYPLDSMTLSSIRFRRLSVVENSGTYTLLNEAITVYSNDAVYLEQTSFRLTPDTSGAQEVAVPTD